jgi:hypothetical protein|tara:strand:- start:123 stop:725 length:603 start_codon:yes stop_codon:yes gene_type:complete
MSEEEIKKLVADETAKQLTEYYRRSYPHFEISSGVESEAHGPTEYCMTTDTYQGIHFYKQGNMKVRSNKSVEIYSGQKATDDDASIHIQSENGYIKIESDDTLILKGKRVQIISEGASDEDGVFIEGGKRLNVDAGNITLDGDNTNLIAAEEMHINGGSDLSLYSEAAPIQISSGAESLFAGGVTSQIMNVLNKAKRFFS